MTLKISDISNWDKLTDKQKEWMYICGMLEKMFKPLSKKEREKKGIWIGDGKQ